MSDLQCPARFLMLGDAEGAAARLRAEHVALVYDGAGGARPAAARLAADLGVPLSRCPDVLLSDVQLRRPAALAVLSGLADLHRGETVVVLAADGAGTTLDVSIDADGVRIA